jgi:hypothetical protein
VSDKPAIRLKFRDLPPVEAPASPPPKIVSAPKPKPKSPTVGTESLVVKCGHTIAFDLYVKDPFRVERRAKETARDCPPCRQARVQAEMAAAAERKAQRKIERKEKRSAYIRAYKPRLPDGSRFAATYDATATRWTGTVAIEGATFEQSASSLSRLLHKLDDAYRGSLAPLPAIAESAE